MWPAYMCTSLSITPLYYMQDITIELQDDLNVIPEAKALVNAATRRRYEHQLHNFYSTWQPESVVVPGMFRGHFVQEEDNPKTYSLEINFTKMDKRATLSLREGLSIMAANGKSEQLSQRIKINGDLCDVPVVRHNIKSGEAITIQIMIDQHPDLVQLSSE